MKLLGNISHNTRTGNVLVRGDKIPELYSLVFTKDKKKVGKVQDVIGPVEKPYFVVKLAKGVDSSRIKGPQLFILEKLKKKKSKRRRYVGKKGGIH